MTRYEILANDLSNMLREQFRSYENKLLLLEPADILDNAWEYIVKSNIVSTIDNLLDSQQLDEEDIVNLLNSSLDEIYDFFGSGFDTDISNIYWEFINEYCLEAKDKED